MHTLEPDVQIKMQKNVFENTGVQLLLPARCVDFMHDCKNVRLRKLHQLCNLLGF